MKKSRIESIIISTDNYYEPGAEKSISTSIVINRIGAQQENLSFQSLEEISEFHRVLTEYLNETKGIQK